MGLSSFFSIGVFPTRVSSQSAVHCWLIGFCQCRPRRSSDVLINVGWRQQKMMDCTGIGLHVPRVTYAVLRYTSHTTIRVAGVHHSLWAENHRWWNGEEFPLYARSALGHSLVFGWLFVAYTNGVSWLTSNWSTVCHTCPYMDYILSRDFGLADQDANTG